MALAIPLTEAQIAAAGRLHGRLEQWAAADRALFALARQFPGFDADAVLLKVVTINALYGTNVYAVLRMARHAEKVMRTVEAATVSLELVERLAELPSANGGEIRRRFHSFASKFAHFFVDPERFPIMDSYAVEMVKHHLGRGNQVTSKSGRYVAFTQNLDKLKALAGLRAKNRELDRYLWLAGQYHTWRRDREARINAELQRFFSAPPADAKADLDAL